MSTLWLGSVPSSLPTTPSALRRARSEKKLWRGPAAAEPPEGPPPAVFPGERHEAAVVDDLLGELALLLAQQHQFLGMDVSHRDHQPAALAQLVNERLGNHRRRRRHQDAVVRGGGLVALAAVSHQAGDVGIAPVAPGVFG